MRLFTPLAALALLACQPGSADVRDTGPGTAPTSGTTDATDLASRITLPGLMGHLEALQDAADANGDTRAVGTPGFDASVAYAQGVLEDAGYTVVLEPFSMTSWQVLSPTELSVPSNPALSFTNGSDYQAMTYSPGGSVTAPLAAVDLVLPPTPSPSSSSGCEPEDFADFPVGSIALVQRGDCFFQDKADNAQAAGAVAMILFNEGQDDRQDLEPWQLSDDGGTTIPVVSASFATGEALAAALDGGPVTVSLTVDAEVVDQPSVNVIAETPGGDADNVLVVGGHLDSVPAGPGINDNGTGVALILELAVQTAEAGFEPRNKVRFALWGAEEVGLVGSTAHVRDLGDSGRSQVLANLNFDMVGSPNGSAMVYDGDGSDYGMSGPPGSDVIEDVFLDWLDGEAQPWFPTLFDGRSDYLEFIVEGIPAGGLFSGAEGTLTSAEADAWGGQAGQDRDPCYHRACDDIDNLNTDLFLTLSKAGAAATQELATRPSLTEPQARVRAPDLELPHRGCHQHHPVSR